MGKRTTIYINPPLEAVLAGSGSTSGRLGTVSDRYLEIIRRARITARLEEAELYALYDCCNGTIFEPAALIDGAVLANFRDSLADGIAEKWEIDPTALIAKLEALTFPEQVALVEEIERFWREHGDKQAGGFLHAEPEEGN